MTIDEAVLARRQGGEWVRGSVTADGPEGLTFEIHDSLSGPIPFYAVPPVSATPIRLTRDAGGLYRDPAGTRWEMR
jgi:hypothetical protein